MTPFETIDGRDHYLVQDRFLLNAIHDGKRRARWATRQRVRSRHIKNHPDFQILFLAHDATRRRDYVIAGRDGAPDEERHFYEPVYVAALHDPALDCGYRLIDFPFDVRVTEDRLARKVNSCCRSGWYHFIREHYWFTDKEDATRVKLLHGAWIE